MKIAQPSRRLRRAGRVPARQLFDVAGGAFEAGDRGTLMPKAGSQRRGHGRDPAGGARQGPGLG